MRTQTPISNEWVDLSDPIGSLRKRLLVDADPGFGRFVQCALPKDSSIALGVRTAVMRQIAKEIASVDGEAFVEAVLFPKETKKKSKRQKERKIEYCEERLVLAFLIGLIKVDFDRRLELVATYLPLIDSWLVCDTLCAALKPKPSEKSDLWDFLGLFFESELPYDLRFALVMTLKQFVDKNHIGAIINRVESVASRKPEAHTVKMGMAWLLCETFVKCPDATLRYFKENELDDFTFNQTLQKICDSLRVDDATKAEIRAMKRVKSRKIKR